ncbi:MAG TPA: aminotransferase class V-fold PLP-dependent enzyme [Luteitalea sp.]|nr:aminotransferase class V-fold PLP-dependent enzyme [Luteitalea sp.]
MSQPTQSSATRDAALAMDGEAFRRLGHSLVESLATVLDGISDRPVTSGNSPAALRDLLGRDRAMPENGDDPARLLERAVTLLSEHSLFNGHPKFLGYITAAPAPLGMLGDLLASAINANVGAWRLSPMASEIEAQTVRWIGELLRYRSDAAGLFVSGGNMANIVGLLAARAAVGRRWDVRARGVGGRDARRLKVYASAETHTWLQKATDICGLGTDAIHWVASTKDQRLDVAALRTAIADDVASGHVPMLVVGTAGTVSTGVVDPLFAMADVCREFGVWFHVDGAYGAPAAAVDGTPHDLQALHLADSVAVDPHKWLYAPLEAGCVLVRDAACLRDAFSYHPPYYHFDDDHGTNFVDLGPQNSRGFRALKVWLMLQQAGVAGYRQMIGDDIALARRLFDVVSTHPRLDACSHHLSITTFRYVPEDLAARWHEPAVATYLNTLNEALLERLQTGGRLFVSNAIVHERYLLRACLVNFRTSAADIDAIPAIVDEIGGAIDAAARPAMLA